MAKTAYAVLTDGQKIPYVISDNPPRGGMKYTYFAPDKSYVVQFFNDPNFATDPNLHSRIEAIIGKFNPTLPEAKGGARGNDEKIANYFSKNFCWPYAIIKSPEFGIVCPTYPSNFFFDERSSTKIPLKGKDKKSNWFTTTNRKYLNASELGDFRSILQISILLARSVRRMHQAGLAHSDLSNNNVLIDPKSGRCVVIDIDSLVVPGLFPPEVAGTRGYIAPEVLSTMGLRFDDPKRKYPCTHTDLHALPVLIYQYIFCRHPLIGPKGYPGLSTEEEDFMELGPKALFIENPNDRTNRPKNLSPAIQDLGPILEKLFIRAFVDGLHSPNDRPTAMEWERGLVQTWDLLHICQNPKCEYKWFVLYDIGKPVCPFCKTRLKNQDIIQFKMKSEARGRSGQWHNSGELIVDHNTTLFKWHVFSNTFPDEKVDRTLQAYICKHNGQWILVNKNINGMLSPSGNSVPIGQAISLNNGIVFRASREDRGMLIEVLINAV